MRNSASDERIAKLSKFVFTDDQVKQLILDITKGTDNEELMSVYAELCQESEVWSFCMNQFDAVASEVHKEILNRMTQ